MRLLHLGNAVVDVVLSVPRWPGPGEDVLATHTSLAAGGGFNVMAAAARQGLPVAYGGAHGTGRFGDLVRVAMRAEGIEVLRPPEPADTGFVVVGVDGDGERTFVTSVGAEARLTEAPEPRRDDLVYISGYGLAHPANRRALLRLMTECDNTVVFDPGPLGPELPDDVLRAVAARADWWSCNAREARLLTRRASNTAATAALHDLARSMVVRTGPDGCLVSMGGDTVHVAGFAVDAVDTNGAGDAHAGVFVAGLAQGLDPVTAARRANAAAALAVTVHGPATAPTAAELNRFLAGAGR